MKIASLYGKITNYAPEFEDCRHLAAKYHIPLKHVIQEALHIYVETSASESASRRTTKT